MGKDVQSKAIEGAKTPRREKRFSPRGGGVAKAKRSCAYKGKKLKRGYIPYKGKRVYSFYEFDV
jgi:hypothetical protein